MIAITLKSFIDMMIMTGEDDIDFQI